VALEDLRRVGVERLYGRYLPTAKNAQVEDLLPRFGARRVGETPEDCEWVIDVSRAALPETDVRDSGPAEPR
jgi:predicted enzyme involved in methoxymalonyl-ACP biosynthesis